MRLTDLHPHWVSTGGAGVTNTATGEPVPYREKIGVGCDCPCGCASAMFIPFANPPDGGPPIGTANHVWQRTGETFEDLTLTPSIQRGQWIATDGTLHGCVWHGFITNGEIVQA